MLETFSAACAGTSSSTPLAHRQTPLDVDFLIEVVYVVDLATDTQPLAVSVWHSEIGLVRWCVRCVTWSSRRMRRWRSIFRLAAERIVRQVSLPVNVCRRGVPSQLPLPLVSGAGDTWVCYETTAPGPVVSYSIHIYIASGMCTVVPPSAPALDQYTVKCLFSAN